MNKIRIHKKKLKTPVGDVVSYHIQTRFLGFLWWKDVKGLPITFDEKRAVEMFLWFKE